ncbi:uncharacterized protein EDB91DRAFT_1139189, partial [Suillus paluster]|uniref:uncharacterized protein n=1 Tax=Suillus paluster TaxID=48578 RepID=UPI001B868E59
MFLLVVFWTSALRMLLTRRSALSSSTLYSLLIRVSVSPQPAILFPVQIVHACTARQPQCRCAMAKDSTVCRQHRIQMEMSSACLSTMHVMQPL